ncbi:MAG: hypothetical protein N4A44_04185 [Alphaproteobacteria bacterium]|jgi:hypothetical protein|nr:hypothetical protein [Alphaproteobacteria bacterium]
MIQKGWLSVCFMILFLVQGCGYSSLYKNDVKVGSKEEMSLVKETSSIVVKPVKTKESKYGIMLRNNLKLLLAPQGENETKKYSLEMKMEDPRTIRRGIKKDGSASIGSLKVVVRFKLKDMDGNVLSEGTVVDYSNFNILDNVYASEVSKDYVKKQLMNSVADELYKRIILYLKK